MESKELIYRLNRIQGQIEAIKKNIAKGETNCTQNIRLLKATTNALKKFGQAYVEQHLENCLLTENVDTKSLDKELKTILNSVFSM